MLRGTNTVERIAASTQVLKSLHRPGVICFAATHDIELTRLLEKEYDNYHFEEQVEEDDIQFNYRLMPGRAGSRNAIRLLGVIGYDQEIIREADRMAQEFLQTGEWKVREEVLSRQETPDKNFYGLPAALSRTGECLKDILRGFWRTQGNEKQNLEVHS